MKKLLFLFVIVNFNLFAQLNTSDISSKITTKEARKELTDNQVKLIEDTFAGLSDSINYDKLSDAFWGMELINYKTDKIKNDIDKILFNYSSYPLNFKRWLLQVIYSMYPTQFLKPIANIMPSETNDKLFAMCANYLMRNGYDKAEITKNMTKNFPEYKESPILYILAANLDENTPQRPNVKDLISHNIKNGYPIVFSFQRKNRDYQGITVIRKIDGKLFTNNSGTPFYIKQLARAVTNMPGYLTNGNTPQGIFSIQKFGLSTNKFIGPTTTIELTLPYEVSPAAYFHDSSLSKSDWNIEMYKNMLPKSWQNYTPIYEAYYAGKAGRNEIISHGTTVDPTYYKDSPFFPNTPTYGCLCAAEVWNPITGQLIQSDQVELVNAFINYGFNKGFLVVIDLDDQQKDVTLEEVVNLFEEN